jgi:hypothetical protein
MKISKSAIFIFELMFVILIFTISAAICTSGFAKAYGFSMESQELTNAALRAESAAEVFKLTPGAGEKTTVYYDEKWQETADAGNSVYMLTETPSKEGNLYICNVEVSKNNEGKDTIFSLDAVKYGKSY